MILPFLRRAWPFLTLAGLLLFTALWIGRALYLDHEIRFLVEYPPARWVVYPSPAATSMRPDVPLDTVFSRSFSLPSVPSETRLCVRALGTCEVHLNGKSIPIHIDPDHWKNESCLDISQFLQPGTNDLAVTVTNDSGPPALWLTLSSPEIILTTDASWKASLAGATPLPSALADDPRPFSDFDPGGTAERVIPSLLRVWPSWLIFAGISVAIFLAYRRWIDHSEPKIDTKEKEPPGSIDAILSMLSPPGRGERVTRIVFILIAFFWIALFLHNSLYLDPVVGFDVKAYLAYIDHFRTAWSVPMPGEAAQTHHPPLYPFLAGMILRIVGSTPDTSYGILAIRLFNLGLALVNLLAILGCLRLIFPGQPRRWILGLLIAGFLPMHLYLYQYPTNHILAGTLASVTIYFVLRILRIPESTMRDYIFLGLSLGLALLSMVTAGLLVPPIGMTLAAKLYLDRARLDRQGIILRIFVPAAVVFGICGWYYLLVWFHCGTPIVADMGIMNAGSFAPNPWWQDPAFRTAGDYLRFGESLRAPLFSVWYSVWDGLYSSLWGDSFCGGFASIHGRPPWSYDHIVAGMSLALLPTVAILLAGGTAILHFLRRPSILWAFLLAITFLFATFLIYGATLLPCYGAVKAFYGLMAGVPLCALAALGLDLFSGQRPWRYGLIFVFMGVWILNVATSYWIPASATETQKRAAIQLMDRGDLTGATDRLEQLVAEYPDDHGSRILLAELYAQQDFTGRARRILAPLSGRNEYASRRHFLLGVFSAKADRLQEALDQLHTAITLSPDDLDSALAYASVVSAGDHDAQTAIDAWRNVLRIAPYLNDAHRALTQLYLITGNPQAAHRHQEYIARIDEARRYRRQTLPPNA